MEKGEFSINMENQRMMDLLINKNNMDTFLINNGKIKKFCPFGFFNKSTNEEIIKNAEDNNNGK